MVGQILGMRQTQTGSLCMFLFCEKLIHVYLSV